MELAPTQTPFSDAETGHAEVPVRHFSQAHTPNLAAVRSICIWGLFARILVTFELDPS